MGKTRVRAACAIVSAVAVAGTAVTGTAAASSASPADAHAGVCAGVKRCHRVAVIDVDGDRRADRVGWRQLNRNRVQIRVRTADGELLKRRVGVRRWPGGGAWGDAAWIDGRRGAELLIAAGAGAHSEHYRMLTYRKGRLVGEPSPWRHSFVGRWNIDASARYYTGWDRNVGRNGRITMTMKVAAQNDRNRRFSGFNVRYAWKHGRWVHVKRTKHTYKNRRRASRIAGWHVGHLQRWPAR